MIHGDKRNLPAIFTPARSRLSPCRFRLPECVVALLLLLFGDCLPARGQEQKPPASSVPQLTLKTVQERLAAIQSRSDIEESLKAKIVDLYEQSRNSLKTAASWDERARKYRKLATGVEERKRKLEEQHQKIQKILAENPSKPPRDEGLDTEKLHELLLTREKELKELRQQLEDPQNGLQQEFAKLKAEDARRTERPGQIIGLKIQQRLDQASDQLKLPRNPDESPEYALAKRTLAQARVLEFTKQSSAGRLELDQYAAEEKVGLLRLKRDVLSLRMTALEKQIKAVQDRVNRLRRDQASRRIEEAREQGAPALEDFRKENQLLTKQNAALTVQIQAAEKRRAELLKTRKYLESQLKDIQQMIRKVGQSNDIGELLRSQRHTIPSMSRYQTQTGTAQKTVKDLPIDWYKFEKSRDRLVDLDEAVRQGLLEIAPKISPDQSDELKEELRNLLEHRKTFLDESIENSRKLFRVLVDGDSEKVKLAQVIDEFTTFIDERVLWIRSDEMLGPKNAADAADAFRWLFDPAHWLAVARSLVSHRWQDVLEIVLTSCLFVTLIYYRQRLRGGIALLGDKAATKGCHSFRPTGQAVVLTLLVAALWPGIVWYLSWRLSQQISGDEFAAAVARGLNMTAAVYFPLEIIRQSCASKGLAEMHFGWSIPAVRLVRTHLRWATPLGLPLIFIAGTIHAQPNEAWQDSLGRLSVVAGLILLAIFMQQTLRPRTGVVRELLNDRGNGWSEQLHYAIYGASLLIPAGFAVLAVMGYYYTVIQLGARLHETVWLFIVLLMIQALLLRLLLVRRRGLAMAQFQAQRASARKEKEADSDGPGEAVPVPVPAAEEKTDLRASMGQTQKLVKTFLAIAVVAGVWVIWADVLPAIGVLDRITLWTTQVTTSENITNSDGETETRTTEHIKPVTIANLIVAILVAVLAVIAAQNIPGLIEMSLLRGLPFEAGFRYAISSLSRYLIVLAGLAIALGTIGIGWDKMQWLFAAASLGLGFGLQEIFANFISGIIILFERPIRVGDIITIDAVSGVVSKIRIRATTITNWDRQELIVPNKDFITGRLLNWTLSDQINRIVIKIGVAYGSDTKQVRALLLGAANDNEFILDDPGPSATFSAFGDSTLDFVLRAYLPNLDNRMGTVHALHCEIDRRCAEAGIEIAFPQQDIHVRSLPKSFGNQSANECE